MRFQREFDKDKLMGGSIVVIRYDQSHDPGLSI